MNPNTCNPKRPATENQPSTAVKSCRCGRRWTALEWRGLPFVGVMDFGEEDEPRLELRNCDCGSTLSRQIEEDAQ